MILRFMDPKGVCTTIYADFRTETIRIENHTDDILHRAFGIKENPTWEDFEYFLEDRCFPRTRDKLKLVLKEIGLDYYDPLQIIRKTAGRLTDDKQWIEFVEG